MNRITMKLIQLLVTVSTFALLFNSCGGKNSAHEASEDGYVLKPWNNSVEVDGPAGEYIQLLDSQIIIKELVVENGWTGEVERGNWGTSIKFKVISQTDDWLGDMEVTFLDEQGNEL